MRGDWLRRYLLALFAIASSLVVVFINWYLVDPFRLRGLSTPIRGFITLFAGLVLGGLLYLALRQGITTRLAVFRHARTSLFLVAAVVIIFLALPMPLAPNRFSYSSVKVQIDHAPEKIWLERIQAGAKPLLLDQCSQQGNWQSIETMRYVMPGESAWISCGLYVPQGTPVSIDFMAATQPALVQISLNGETKTINLQSVQNSKLVTEQLIVPPQRFFGLTYLARLMDALFLLLIGFGAHQFGDMLQRTGLKGSIDASITGFNTWFDSNTPRFAKVAIGAGIVSALMTGFLFLQPLVSSQASKAVQIKAGKTPPNIFFIVVDALSANDMSLFGYALPTTPNLDQITRDWSVYTNAQSPQTCTVMALPAFMTGRYPYKPGLTTYGDVASANQGWLSLPGVLKSAGYQTWWMGYNTPGYYHLGSGFDGSVCRAGDPVHNALYQSWFKFRAILKNHFPFIPLSFDMLHLTGEENEDYTVCNEMDSLDNLLRSTSIKQPFFVFDHYRGVHGFPYPSGNQLGAFLPLDGGMFLESDQHGGAYEPEQQAQVDKLRLRYDESIASQDQKLSDFIQELKKLGIYDSSMIIITADHGQSFNDGYTSHCTWLVSEAEAHVPLLIKYPYQTQGQRVDNLVSTIDVTPTILDSAGFVYPSSYFDGISLLNPAQIPADGRIVFTRRMALNNSVSIPSDLAVTDGQYRLVMRKGKLFLYAIQQDPLETVDLLEKAGYADLPQVQKLKQALENYRQRWQALQQGENILKLPPLVP